MANCPHCGGALPEAPELPEEITIVFRQPIEFVGDSYPSITIQEPTFEQLVRMSKAESSIESVALLAGVPIGVIKQMKARDANKAGDFLRLFT
jgi:hypothetical protein